METVTSRANPRVKAAAALHRRRERLRTGQHLVEGPNAVGEALAAGVVTTVFAIADRWSRITVPADVERVTVTEDVLARVADTRTPQGIVAVARTVAVDPEQVPRTGLLVVLHGLADPGNVGTIVRTADAAGAAAVWATPSTADVHAPKAVRAAAGSTYHLPIVCDGDLAALRRHVDASGRRLLALDAAAHSSVGELDPHRPAALLLANEAHGLDDATRAVVDGTVRVPMPGAAESLNVAAAAAVAIYAATGALGPPRPIGQ